MKHSLIIDDAVDQWPSRLRACFCTNGRHCEHFETIKFVFSVLDELMLLITLDAAGHILTVHYRM